MDQSTTTLEVPSEIDLVEDDGQARAAVAIVEPPIAPVSEEKPKQKRVLLACAERPGEFFTVKEAAVMAKVKAGGVYTAVARGQTVGGFHFSKSDRPAVGHKKAKKIARKPKTVEVRATITTIATEVSVGLAGSEVGALVMSLIAGTERMAGRDVASAMEWANRVRAEHRILARVLAGEPATIKNGQLVIAILPITIVKDGGQRPSRAPFRSAA